MPLIIQGAFSVELVFGVQDIPAIVDLPSGARIRIRQRKGKFTRVFVRTKHGTAEYYLATKNGHYRLGPKVRENIRTKLPVVQAATKRIGILQNIVRMRPRKLFL
jgi:hypothetical protein